MSLKQGDEDDEEHIQLLISFRGQTLEIDLSSSCDIDLEQVQSKLVTAYTEKKSEEGGNQLDPSDIKVMFKGRVLSDYSKPMFQLLSSSPSISQKKKTRVVRLVALGQSSTEIEYGHLNSQLALSSSSHRLIRDDLTDVGQKQLHQIRKVGRGILNKHTQRAGPSTPQKYGFHKIQTLPLLAEEFKAREILLTLSQDPGILACMAHHQWNVGCLSEMYPEGKVGESEICIMGLNRNKGGEILLRLRTDDLKGFRKMTSIRKVLYHELAHNVHSEHDGAFFQLMRQIEKECVEMNWSKGEGHRLSSNDASEYDIDQRLEETEADVVFEGGVYRLGGGDNSDSRTGASATNTVSRELRAQAAMNRLQVADHQRKNEMERKNYCPCNRPHCNKHLDCKPK